MAFWKHSRGRLGAVPASSPRWAPPSSTRALSRTATPTFYNPHAPFGLVLPPLFPISSVSISVPGLFPPSLPNDGNGVRQRVQLLAFKSLAFTISG